MKEGRKQLQLTAGWPLGCAVDCAEKFCDSISPVQLTAPKSSVHFCAPNFNCAVNRALKFCAPEFDCAVDPAEKACALQPFNPLFVVHGPIGSFGKAIIHHFFPFRLITGSCCSVLHSQMRYSSPFIQQYALPLHLICSVIHGPIGNHLPFSYSV